MKKSMICWAVSVVTMLAMSACSTDWDEILNEKNLLDDAEVVQLDTNESKVHKPTEECDIAIYACYEEKTDLGDMYAIDEAKLLNWKDRTLVIVHVFYCCGLYDFSTEVYEKDGKYVIEVLEEGIQNEGSIFRNMALDKRCFAFILDKPGVSPKDIKLKAGIVKNKKDGKRYHEFLETKIYP
jgi:hypothetical protein